MSAGIIRPGAFAAVMVFFLASPSVIAENLTRGPYLQKGTDSSIVVRWRSDQATDSVVRYGAAPGQLNMSASAGANTTEHEIELTGLAADTVYFYSVGSSGGAIAGDDTEHFFRTSPVPGTVRNTRIWVLGDSGTANSNAAAVREAYLAFTGIRTTDLLMMLGDNAYTDGTDAQYQNAVFDMYPQVLRQTPVWPTLGNHDGFTADSNTESGPYYDIFSLPRQAEAGGLASGTEAYYSFDYGNIHFICLESYETDRSPGGPMMSWLADDVAATTATWIIAFWHHPPYTKGSHNSDTESNLIDMRVNALPILESHGVDLVLSGHSHSYERSFLIDGHYGDSGTFGAINQVDAGDGRVDSDGSYDKLGGPGAPNAGAVYAVAGSSGLTSGGSLDHNAMFISLSTLGSMVLDVNGNRLDAIFLASDGDIDDYFTMTKGPDETLPVLESAATLDETTVLVTFSEAVDPVTAADLANYLLNLGTVVAAVPQADGRSVLLTTTSLLVGFSYVLTVSDVSDVAGNVIAPDSQALFTLQILQTVEFQNGVSPGASYDGARDTWIDENNANSNHGSSSVLLVDGNDGGGGDLSSLMAWDVSALVAGSAVQSAQIVLNVFDPTVNSYGLFEIKRDWQENEATWNDYANSMSWQAAGAKGAGDRGTLIGNVSSVPVGATNISLNGTGVALVQAWVDGAPNYGLILADESSSNGMDVRSNEYAIAGSRPKLVVTYAVPADNDDDGVVNSADNCILAANPDQRDTDTDGFGNLCDADLNNDGVINALDLGLMKTSFFNTGDLDADLDGDGIVNIIDLGLMKAAFFGSPGPSGVAQ